MDVAFVRKMSAKTTAQCRKEHKAIEQGLSPCFRMNPGRKLDQARCDELRAVLDHLEEQSWKSVATARLAVY